MQPIKTRKVYNIYKRGSHGSPHSLGHRGDALAMNPAEALDQWAKRNGANAEVGKYAIIALDFSEIATGNVKNTIVMD